MRFRLVLSAILLLACPRAAWAEEAKPAGLAESLKSGALPLTLADGKLAGAGAQALLAAARSAQFFLLGEDHGFADPPEFAIAVQRALGEHRFDHLVIEAGYHSIAEAEAKLRGKQGAEALAELSRQNPSALSFMCYAEDCALAAEFVKLGPGRRLWGVDQEILFAAALNFELLQRLVPSRDAALQGKIAAYAQKMRAVTAEALAAKQLKTPLLTLQDADFNALREFFPQGNAAARALVDDMALSARIYRLGETSGYQSNRERSRLMKRYFMSQYQEAAQQARAPRAMFKMGAFHTGRGRSATNQLDLGNLVSELAEGQGGESCHVLLAGIGGFKNAWFPWSPDRADQKKPYLGSAALEIMGLKPLLEAAAERKEWTVFDLRPLRLRRAERAGASPATEALIFHYDFVVVVPELRPARYLE